MNKIFRWYLKRYSNAISLHYKQPFSLQQMVFEKIISSNKDTLFGKSHGFKHIQSKAEYAQQVPVQHYDDILPYIRKIILNEQNVLTKKPNMQDAF